MANHMLQKQISHAVKWKQLLYTVVEYYVMLTAIVDRMIK